MAFALWKTTMKMMVMTTASVMTTAPVKLFLNM